MSRAGDELLAVVSARQRLPWRAFREAFDVLHARAIRTRSGIEEPVGNVRQRSLRLLSELGHAELMPFEASATVCIAPTVLAMLPRPGLPTACLCGSRSTRSAAALRHACSAFGEDARVYTVNHPFCGGYAAASIQVQVTDAAVLQTVADISAIGFAATPPAWRLLQSSASTSEYERQLEWHADLDPQWLRKDFNASTFTFGFARAAGSERFSSYQDPITHRQIHRIWRGSQTASADRDWGRWLHLRDLSVSVLIFDEARQAVAVPATVPLPGLLGRSLSLFSGLAPHRMPHPRVPARQIDVYTGVVSEAAELLAGKLGHPLVADQLEEV